jgi:transmembrane protein EpsG
MDIKILLFAIAILLGIFLNDDQNGVKRKWYVIIMVILFVLESSLRSVWVGPDTIYYYQFFENTKDTSWQELWQLFKLTYIEGKGKDPGFYVYMKIIQLFSSNFNVFLFVSALIFFVPLGVIWYRYSTSILQLIFAFTLYIALFNIVALSGIRQQIATGFSFMALLQLGRDRYLKSVILIAVGALVHVSVLFFLSVVVLKLFFMEYIKKIHLFSFMTIPFIFVSAGPIMLFFASFLANEYYSGYGSSESTGAASLYVCLMELLSLFCYIAIKKVDILRDKTVALLYPMLPLLTMAVPLISVNGAMIRIGQYFTFYLMLLVPQAIDCIAKDSDRRIIYWCMIAALFFLSVQSGGFTYHFFWQELQFNI